MAESPQRVTWPPRLAGALFEGERPFNGSAYLRLDNLTVLLGANGAGKSTTLRLIEQHLPSLLPPATPADASQDDAATRCSFFVELTDEQLAVLLEETLGEAINSDLPAGEVIEVAARHLASTASTDPHQLRASRLIKVDAAANDSFDVAWCKPTTDAGTEANSPLGDSSAFAPSPVAPLGRTSRAMLPLAIAVPRALDDVRLQLRDAIVAVLIHLEWAERDRWAYLHGVPVQSSADREGTRAWLKETSGDVVAINPDARSLCNLASALATTLAPEFVTRDHALRIEMEPIHDWSRGGPTLRLSLRRRTGSVEFPMAAAADGHKVWLQFAILEAVAILRRYLGVLEGLLEQTSGSREGASGANRTAWSRYDAAITLLRSFGTAGAEVSGGALEQFTSLRNVGHRLYLIDEPEQHLHPRLQRLAARWLVGAGTAGASQCLVVTHSPHYLRIPGRVSFAYLQQVETEAGGPRSVIRLLTPSLLHATDEVARDMGFDRGELLSAVSTVVFVEGLADKLFLDAYCGERLHHAGVALVPIHGAVHAERKGVVDSEIVLGWTGARLAILLDNLVEAEWEQLATDDQYCLEQSRKPAKTELKAMADVLLRSKAVGRDILPLGIPVDDIFDLLDEDLLRERFPSFPGHSAARAAWEDACATKRVNWKTYYADKFQLEIEPTLFGEIGGEMAARGVRPAETEKLVKQLVGLTELA